MGDVGLVGFVTDFTQLFDVVVQGNQIGGAYGFGHDDTRVCTIEPV